MLKSNYDGSGPILLLVAVYRPSLAGAVPFLFWDLKRLCGELLKEGTERGHLPGFAVWMFLSTRRLPKSFTPGVRNSPPFRCVFPVRFCKLFRPGAAVCATQILLVQVMWGTADDEAPESTLFGSSTVLSHGLQVFAFKVHFGKDDPSAKEDLFEKGFKTTNYVGVFYASV